MDFEKIIEEISASCPSMDSDEYIGEDGLLHCSVCHDHVQTVINPFGKERVVRCICSCVVKKREEEAERERARAVERRRRVCFNNASRLMGWTFETDDRSNEKLSDALIRYTEDFPSFLREGRGFLLTGDTGTGKTYLAACVANRLIEKGFRCLMTNLTSLIDEMEKGFGNKKDIIDDLKNYQLLIIDDLGAERNTSYMQGEVFKIIDARCSSGLPFIITTNISLDRIKKPEDLTEARIYDRILEKCFPIKVEGVSKRRESVAISFYDTKKRLEL